jgi:hypothetical protein
MASSNDPAHIDDPEFWQTRANEARAKAAAMTGAAAKAKMIAAAEHYEALIVRIKMSNGVRHPPPAADESSSS